MKAEVCLKVYSLHWQSRDKSFYKQIEGPTYRNRPSALTDILKFIIGDLISVILVVSGTVNLPLQGWLVLISLRSVLGTVAAYVMATV